MVPGGKGQWADGSKGIAARHGVPPGGPVVHTAFPFEPAEIPPEPAAGTAGVPQWGQDSACAGPALSAGLPYRCTGPAAAAAAAGCRLLPARGGSCPDASHSTRRRASSSLWLPAPAGPAAAAARNAAAAAAPASRWAAAAMCRRVRAAASSITSMALSGRRRSGMYRCAALTAAAGRVAQYNAVQSAPATSRGQLGTRAQRNKGTILQSIPCTAAAPVQAAEPPSHGFPVISAASVKCTPWYRSYRPRSPCSHVTASSGVGSSTITGCREAGREEEGIDKRWLGVVAGMALFFRLS